MVLFDERDKLTGLGSWVKVGLSRFLVSSLVKVWLSRFLFFSFLDKVPYVERLRKLITRDVESIQLLQTVISGLRDNLGGLEVPGDCMMDDAGHCSSQVTYLLKTINILRNEKTSLETALSEEKAMHAASRRLLTVGHGSTFDELRAAGRVGKGVCYNYEDLVALTTKQHELPPGVPPLVFLHVPKSGGTTLNNILMKNYRLRVDSYGDNFFEHLYPDEFCYYLNPPSLDDTRLPVFFTGHVRLSNEIFTRMHGRYLTISMLRDPVERMISNYRFHKRLPNNQWNEAIWSEELSPITFLKKFWDEIPRQYQLFLDRAEDECDSPVEEALRNLEAKITLFGLTDRFDEFMLQLAALLGLPDVSYRLSLNKTPDHVPPVPPGQKEELREMLKCDIAFHDGAVALYERRIAALPFDIAGQAEEFKNATADDEKRRKHQRMHAHPWEPFYS